MPYYPYTRRRVEWYLRNVMIAIAVIVAVTGIIGAGVTSYQVSQSHRAAEQAAVSNHFWRGVAGLEPIDGSTRLGQLAQMVRDDKSKSDLTEVIEAMQARYIEPNTLGGVSGDLGIVVAKARHNSSHEIQDEGHFTPEFILTALQADPQHIQKLTKPIPPAKTPGVFTWLNLLWAELAIGLVTLVGWGGFAAYRSQRWRRALANRKERAKRKREQELKAQREREEFAALPNALAQDAYRLVKQIERGGTTSDPDLLADAQKLLDACKRGVGGSAEPIAASFRTELNDLQERFDQTERAYRELPQ